VPGLRIPGRDPGIQMVPGRGGDADTGKEAAGMIAKKKLAVIHIAKAQTGMTDEEYRDLLSGFGVASSKDLKAKDFDKLMARFERLGFRTTSPRRRKVKNLRMGRAAMMSKIEAILLDLGYDWKYVDAIARKRFGMDAVQWLDDEGVRKIMQMMIYHQKRREAKEEAAC
jgi:phage gp16-like protein